MSKTTKEFLGTVTLLLLLVAVGVLAIFLFQSYFHPYTKDCHIEAVGKVCKVAYHLYWKPTLSI